jgi:FixJ family two-component response regulator
MHTPREKEILSHVVSGKQNKQIAFDLQITVKTVKAHRTRAMRKMGAKTLAELVHFAGLLEPRDDSLRRAKEMG